MSKIKLVSVVKLGIRLAAALVALFTLSVGKEAAAITLSFEELAVSAPLFDQYAAEGIYFRDSLSLSGNSPGVIAATGYASARALQPNQSASPIFILLTSPANYFSFYKWEPFVQQDPPQEAPVQQDAPTEEAPSDYTVYWEFFKYDGTYQSIGTISDSNKDAWALVSFPSSEMISAVKISGIIDNNLPFYLDNIQITGAIPEPETYAMLLAGLGLLGFMARRKKHN
jgi:hypothetical protein